MPQLQDLPIEILVNIFEDDNQGREPFLSRIVCTNSFFRDLALPIIRRTFEYYGSRNDDYYGWELAGFVKSFVKCPELQEGLRSLVLYNWYRTTRHIEAVLEDVVPPQVGWKFASKIPAFLVWNSVKLEKLQIEYPYVPGGPQFRFLDGVHPSLHSLTVLPCCLGIQIWRPKVYLEHPLHGTIDIDFLPHMLLSPKLTDLTIKARNIINDNEEALSGMPRRTSSVKHLSLQIGNMTDAALRLLVNAPESLISFDFQPTTASDVYFPDSASTPYFGSRVEDLPSTSTIGIALRRHFDTLECITLRRGGLWWHPNLDKIGTLRDMKRLRELEIEASLLLGFNHCQHIINLDIETSYPASSLASLLPASLQNLTLYLDDQHHARNGGDYVRQIIEGIINDLERLANLFTNIGVCAGNDPYCEECDNLSRQNSATFYDNTKERHISLQEARKVKNLLASTKIHFDKGVECYWDEEESKVYLNIDIDEDFNVLPESAWRADGILVQGQTQVNIDELPVSGW